MEIPIYNDTQFEQMLSTIKPGEYAFKVLSAEEKTSKAGNEMMEVSMLVNIPGNQTTLKDYLTVIPNPTKEEYPVEAVFNKRLKAHAFSARKIRDFLQTLGLSYDTTSMNPSKLINKSGRLMVKLEKQEGDDRAWARVDYYITQATKPTILDLGPKKTDSPKKEDVSAETFDDDIPF